MNSFNLNITVGLTPEAAEILRRISTPDMPCHCDEGMTGDAFEQRVTDICVGVLKQLSRHAKPEENPVEVIDGRDPETQAKPGIKPEAPAPAPEDNSGTEEITDAALRQAVKEAKDRCGGNAVRALFAEFEIPNSSACPQERRSDLMDRLAKLNP